MDLMVFPFLFFSLPKSLPKSLIQNYQLISSKRVIVSFKTKLDSSYKSAFYFSHSTDKLFMFFVSTSPSDVKQYANLIKTLSFLLKSYKPKVSKAFSAMNSEHNGDTCLALPYPAFLMSWRRRIGKEDESLFFNGCENAGLQVQHLGSRVYYIKPCETSIDEPT